MLGWVLWRCFGSGWVLSLYPGQVVGNGCTPWGSGGLRGFGGSVDGGSRGWDMEWGVGSGIFGGDAGVKGLKTGMGKIHVRE